MRSFSSWSVITVFELAWTDTAVMLFCAAVSAAAAVHTSLQASADCQDLVKGCWVRH